jgi:hypothetical protein
VSVCVGVCVCVCTCVCMCVCVQEQYHGVNVTMSKRWKYVFADISKGVSGEVVCVCVCVYVCL